MTNYEHYKNQIEKFTRMGRKVAVKKDTNEIIPCADIGCGGCLFGAYDSCTKESMAWADAEYIEPEVDCSKLAVDTPILVKDSAEMKVVIIKHLVNKELNWECGYYLVNGKLVIQNGEHWSVIPHMYGRSIVECVYDITQEAKDAIKEALVKAGEQE
nr:MAG TPA: hypothetical protein [Caudoviricetes sp.]